MNIKTTFAAIVGSFALLTAGVAQAAPRHPAPAHHKVTKKVAKKAVKKAPAKRASRQAPRHH